MDSLPEGVSQPPLIANEDGLHAQCACGALVPVEAIPVSAEEMAAATDGDTERDAAIMATGDDPAHVHTDVDWTAYVGHLAEHE